MILGIIRIAALPDHLCFPGFLLVQIVTDEGIWAHEVAVADVAPKLADQGFGANTGCRGKSFGHFGEDIFCVQLPGEIGSGCNKIRQRIGAFVQVALKGSPIRHVIEHQVDLLVHAFPNGLAEQAQVPAPETAVHMLQFAEAPHTQRALDDPLREGRIGHHIAERAGFSDREQFLSGGIGAQDLTVWPER